MSQSIKDSRQQALLSESELWEYLIAHDEVQDFERWVIGYRQSLSGSFSCVCPNCGKEFRSYENAQKCCY